MYRYMFAARGKISEIDVFANSIQQVDKRKHGYISEVENPIIS